MGIFDFLGSGGEQTAKQEIAPETKTLYNTSSQVLKNLFRAQLGLPQDTNSTAQAEAANRNALTPDCERR